MGERPQFGNRNLTSEEDVFQHNAWYTFKVKLLVLFSDWLILFRDNVNWGEEQIAEAEDIVRKNSVVKYSESELEKYEKEADKNWDLFYNVHDNKFFKDRHWLFTEFSELAPRTESPVKRHIFEIGCGVGNTILPILKYRQSENDFVFGGDFSQTAIQILQDHAEFDPKRCNVFVLDATAPAWEVPFEKEAIDIIVLIFVLSAINPSK